LFAISILVGVLHGELDPSSNDIFHESALMPVEDTGAAQEGEGRLRVRRRSFTHHWAQSWYKDLRASSL